MRGDHPLQVFVLGPTELQVDGEPVQVSRPLERALVVRLALARGTAVPDEALARDIWGDGEVDDPVVRLRVLVHRLRRTLGDHAGLVHRSASGYALAAEPTDLLALERAQSELQSARRADDRAGQLAAIGTALDHWRGPALADLRQTPFGDAEGARLDATRLELQIARIDAELARGGTVGADLDQLVAANPLHERLVGLSAIALYRAGRQADALDRLARLRKSLAEELGVDPSPETSDLELRLLRQDPGLSATATEPATPAASTPPAGLPQLRWQPAGTAFVGRDGESAVLLELLSTPSLVTLTGGPGMGKTRLAREVAIASQTAGRPVAWLDLAPVTTAEAVVPGLAAAVGVDGPADPLPRCADQLTGALLVIDNAEHLVDTVAELLTTLRRRSTDLSVLVTSQRPVRISGEEVHQLGPLGRDAAIALFRSRSGTGPDERIDTICAAVDRSPLAIELAAGLTRTLSIDQLANRIEHRLRLLVGGNRDTGTRHNSLRAAVDWSHALLAPAAQRLLHRLAAFAGGFTLEAAEQVAIGNDIEAVDVAGLLAELDDRCLITVDTRGHSTRYRLLETIRDYALDQLRGTGEQSGVRRRHADWCAELAARTQQYGGPDHAELLRELGDEEANLRAAIEWALGPDGEPGRVLGIVAPTWWYWWSRGLTGEARDWLRRALTGSDPTPNAERAAALRATASLTRSSGEYAEARTLGEQALAIYRELGDDIGQITCLVGLCITSLALQESDTALELGSEAVERARQAGQHRILGTAVNVTGGALRGLGRRAEAEAMFLEACDLWRAVDDRRGLAGTLSNLAIVAYQSGDLVRARELCLESLRLYRELDLTEGLLDVVEIVAALEVAEGRPEPALRLLAAAAIQRIRIGAPLIIPDERAIRDQAESAARQALGQRAAQIATTAQDLRIDPLVDDLLS